METISEVAKLFAQFSAIIIFLSLLVGVAWKAWRFIYKTAKYAEHVHETVGRVDSLIEKQLTNNGGESMLDMMQEVRATVRSLDQRVTVLESK